MCCLVLQWNVLLCGKLPHFGVFISMAKVFITIHYNSLEKKNAEIWEGLCM
jgi:hypothetical protein